MKVRSHRISHRLCEGYLTLPFRWLWKEGTFTPMQA